MMITLLKPWAAVIAFAVLKELLFFKFNDLKILAKNGLLFRFSFEVY
jgi:hypothetical protein